MTPDYDTPGNTTCAEFVHGALATIPILLGRLVLLASLKDPRTGEYNERALAVRFGKDEVDRVLRQEHKAVFEAWLCLSLAEQTAEMEGYATEQGMPPRAVFSAWARERLYYGLIPQGAREPQRDLFLSDMAVILDVLLR